MWDFSIGRALGMMGKTWPFIVFRMAVYFGIAAAYVLVTGVGAGIGWGVGAVGDEDFRLSSTMWGGGLGFVLTAGVIYFLREYILYIVKAGHIAVLVELMDGRPIPDGRGQIDYATSVVKTRFAEASVLFGVDQLVKGVLRAITGLVEGVASILPIPGLQQIVGLVRAFLRIAVGLVDEVILAYAIRTRSTNPWASAHTALVLYGQNYKVMLKNAAWLTIFSYGLAFVVFLLMLAPAAALVWFVPGGWSAGRFRVRADLCLGGQGGADRALRHRLHDGGLLQGHRGADARCGMGSAPVVGVAEVQRDQGQGGRVGRAGRWPAGARRATILRCDRKKRNVQKASPLCWYERQQEVLVHKDEVKGAGKQAKGAIKDAVGGLTGNEKLQAEGKLDKAAGKVQAEGRRSQGQDARRAQALG